MTAMLLLMALLHSATATPNCVNDAGANVDWFMSLKGSNSYDLYGASSRSKNIKKSEFTLKDDDSAITRILNQAYDQNVSSLLYGDQADDGSSHNTFGHTKGVFAWDETGGIWLVHSVPRFPNKGTTYTGYPDYAVVYAQNFMCITLTRTQIENIAYMLQWYRPYIYQEVLHDIHLEKMPNMAALAGGVYNKQPTYHMETFKSKGGVIFVGWGTAVGYDADIYYEAVAKYFDDNVQSNTWLNGRDVLPSFCKPEYEHNVRNIRLINADGTEWKTTQDHSKWAVTENKPNVCFGGKNRQASQMTRQGGVVCFEEPTLWKSLSATVTDIDECGKAVGNNATTL